jgi:hypothetical protein
MIEEVRQFFRTTTGQGVAIVLAVVALGLAVVSVRNNLGPSDASAFSRDRLFVCSETGKTFEYEVKRGDTIPVLSPHSGKKTGYQAEFCFWTKDGGTKPEPTPVLLNVYANKSGPTFCPDCGRLVRQLNPPPVPGVKAPPTQAELAEQANRPAE